MWAAAAAQKAIDRPFFFLKQLAVIAYLFLDKLFADNCLRFVFFRIMLLQDNGKCIF